MSPCLGLQRRLRQKSRSIKRDFLRGSTHALVPIFLVAGSGFASTDGMDVFSELASFPTVTISEEVGNSVNGSLPVSGEIDPEQDADFVRCRWQMDRILMTSFGKGNSGGSVAGCLQAQVGGVSVVSQAENREIQEKVISLTSDGYPLSAMAASIATYDSRIAGLIVGIAKKESDWGKRTPKLHGEECFNYWGYRGYGNRGVTKDGYGCFVEPADAVHAIGNRLIELSSIRGTTDPERMVVWKCGSSCATHSPESVRKWISDVELYYRQFAGAL